VEETKRSLEGLAKPITVPLRPDFQESYFQGVLARMSNRSVSVSVVPRSGTPLAP